MVVAVAIAVVIVVASIPVEVEAPVRAPEFPWAPVVQRRRAKAGLGLGLPDASPKPPHTNIVVANPMIPRFITTCMPQGCPRRLGINLARIV